MTPNDDISRREFGRLVGAAAIGGTLIPDMSVKTPASQSNELCFMPAVELAARIRRKDVSAREVMAAHLSQIERVNPRVNAIVTLVADRAMADAARADEATARGDKLGPLHGLPIAHKDLVETAGIRTTSGGGKVSSGSNRVAMHAASSVSAVIRPRRIAATDEVIC